jgi:hypothetical protein
VAYDLDLTASLPANYVTSIYRRTAAGPWAIVLDGGAFYTKDLIVTDLFDGGEMTPIVQYRALHAISAAIIESGGKEVCGFILITDNSVSQVSIRRRIVGGPNYSTIGSDIQKIIDDNDLNSLDSSAWSQVINPPEQYPPEVHTHYKEDIYGFETATYILEKIKEAITLGDAALYGMIYQYIDRKFSTMQNNATDKLNALEQTIQAIADKPKFEANQIVFFTDATNPATLWGGTWERIPDGLVMMTSDNSLIGTRKKIGEGPDYYGVYYAAWRYISG